KPISGTVVGERKHAVFKHIHSLPHQFSFISNSAIQQFTFSHLLIIKTEVDQSAVGLLSVFSKMHQQILLPYFPLPYFTKIKVPYGINNSILPNLLLI